jgi:mannosyltransferase
MLTKAHMYKAVPYFPIFLFLLNLGLKLLHLTSFAIGHDEPFSIYYAQSSLGAIFDELKKGNNPPLFEMLLHFWIKLFGISPFSVRMLPTLFACLCPVVLYYFAKRNFYLRAGIFSSLLLTFSDLLLYYSHDCRVYSLFVLLTLLSVYYYLEVICSNRITFFKQILFVCFSTLLIYAHYFGFFVLIIQSAHLLFFHKKQFLKTSISYVLILLLYLPCVLNIFTRFDASIKGTWVEPPSGIDSLYNMLWSFSNFPFITVTCIAVLFFGGLKAIISKAYLKWKEGSATILVLGWFLIPFFGMFFISYWMPMYISRYLVFILPAYYILIVLCSEILFKKAIYGNILLIILVSCFAFTNDLNPDKKQPIFEAINSIKQNKDTSTLVVIGSDQILPTIAYHYNRTCFSLITDGKEYYLTDSLLRKDNVYCICNPGEIKQLLIGKFTKVIYLGIDGKSNSSDYPLLSTINAAYSLEKQKELKGGDWKLSFYAWPKK